jgi:hypothetical protein
MAELAKIAVDAGCLFIRWLVLQENASALVLPSIGAEVSEGWPHAPEPRASAASRQG